MPWPMRFAPPTPRRHLRSPRCGAVVPSSDDLAEASELSCSRSELDDTDELTAVGRVASQREAYARDTGQRPWPKHTLSRRDKFVLTTGLLQPMLYAGRSSTFS
jgi:hypothetical protein